MCMGQAFVADTQQTGPRGGDKFYSVNQGMFAAQHAWGKGALEFDTMLSLEPATVSDRRYPELFQSGETAFGRPIIDGQHPHELIMALGVHYARPLNDNVILQLYFAPVGDPALGPVAFPHRASAAELPQAPLGHHWEDSTHIANEVVTAGIQYRWLRLEASGFYGTEPDENRWNIDHGPINSWSARLWWTPSPHWAAQVSTGRLARPERQQPGDVMRTTASVEYSRAVPGGAWSSSVIWGRNRELATKHTSDAYLAESVLPLHRANYLTGRVESVDKDELFELGPASLAGRSFRIGAYTLGYTRDIGRFAAVQTGIGANVTGYSLPSGIKPYYGSRPAAVDVFIRFRLDPGLDLIPYTIA